MYGSAGCSWKIFVCKICFLFQVFKIMLSCIAIFVVLCGFSPLCGGVFLVVFCLFDFGSGVCACLVLCLCGFSVMLLPVHLAPPAFWLLILKLAFNFVMSVELVLLPLRFAL